MPVRVLAAVARADRSYLERIAIGLLSQITGGDDRGRKRLADWLGHDAANPKVVRSGLWNVNHVEQNYDGRFIEILAGVAAMEDAS